MAQKYFSAVVKTAKYISTPKTHLFRSQFVLAEAPDSGTRLPLAKVIIYWLSDQIRKDRRKW